MPPRIPPLVVSQSSTHSSRCIRSFHTSIQTNRPRSLFPGAAPPPSGGSRSKPPSKYNLLNRRTPSPSAANDPYQWSTMKPTTSSSSAASASVPLPISRQAFQINAEQNILNQLRINPVDIDPHETPSEEEEAQLMKWNREHGSHAAGTCIHSSCHNN